MRERLGLCWGSVPGGGLFDIAQAAAGAGLGTITITARHYDDAVATGLSPKQIRARLADLGVRVAVIDPLMAPLPGLPPIDEVPEAMRHFFAIDEEMCLRAAEGVDAPVINMAHFLGQPVETERLIEVVAGVVERARSLTVTLEFIPGTGVSDIGQAHRIAHAAGAKVMVDSWHLARSGGALSDLEQLPPASIGGVQISDWRAPPPGTAYVPMSGRLLPGEGELPLAELMAAIEANSPRLDMCIEVFSAEMEALGWDEAARRMADAARKILPQPF